jgi:two-component system cell cycle response regulator
MQASRKTTGVTRREVADAIARAKTQEPALIMLEGDLPGQVFRLREGRQLIGRRPECEIRLRERAVSGLHAEVLRERESVTINDLGSTNGTLVDGARIRTALRLAEGSLLRLGNCVFKFVDSLLDVEFLESLHARGTRDALTESMNQPDLMARMAFAIDTASEERPLSVVAFDYDDFKLINDEHGHAAGDYVLRASAMLVRRIAVRDEDLFARIGGEEFAIAMPSTTVADAAETAERVRAAFAAHVFDFAGKPIRFTVSFGVCASTSPAERPQDLLARADALLYQSKREGRNRVSVG